MPLKFRSRFQLPRSGLDFGNRPGEKGSPGATNFIQLKDTPDDYNGQAGNYVKVNTTEEALIFSAGTGGVSNHSGLTELDYASAGHTGFEPTVSKGNVTAGSTKITLGGTPTGAAIGAGFSINVDETNINHNNLTNTHNLTTDIDHGSINGLSDDDHSQYALLSGRTGGQTLRGGTTHDAGDNLRLVAGNGLGGSAAEIGLYASGSPTYPGGIEITGFTTSTGNNGGNVKVTGGNGDEGGDVYLVGGIGGTTNLRAGNIYLRGGSIINGSLNASGGSIYLEAGSEQGTGNPGQIVLNGLPTSDPGVTNAVFNSGGQLWISP